MKRFFSLTLALIMAVSIVSVVVAATEANDNNYTDYVPDEWVYVPAQYDEAELFGETESVSDLVTVTVTAKNKSTGAKEYVANAEVGLYVGDECVQTSYTDADGKAQLSLKGLSIEERMNATIAAKKVVSRGKAVDGDERDSLFEGFPVDEDGDYYRYTLELHSETIDENGNWKGAEIPVSHESNKVDMVFIIDVTGSMGDEINNVKNNVAAFSENLLAKGLDTRIAIIEYQDITCAGEYTILHTVSGSHWHNTAASVVRTLSNMSLGYGGDYEETVIDALGMMADRDTMSWRSDAYKFAFVLTDADYKVANNYGYTSLEDVIVDLKDIGIVTSVIGPTDEQHRYTPLYTQTGGIFADIYDSNFKKQMLSVAESIGSSLSRELELALSEPRMLINLSVCYTANNKETRSEEYREAIRGMLCEYADMVAESTDGHVFIDKLILFSTPNKLNYSNVNNLASKADIKIRNESKGAAKYNLDTHVNGFYTSAVYKENASGYDKDFDRRPASTSSKRFYTRIELDVADWTGWKYGLMDEAYLYAATLAHETGHYVFGLFDENINDEAISWNDIGSKPYENFGLMDNPLADIELSKTPIDYAYIKYDDAETFHWHAMGGFSTEDTLAEFLTTGKTSFITGDAYCFYYELPEEGIFADNRYAAKYTKAVNKDRTAEYPLAKLEEDDFIEDYDGKSASLMSDDEFSPEYFEDFEMSLVNRGNIEIESTIGGVEFTISPIDDEYYEVYYLVRGDDAFTQVEMYGDVAEIPVEEGEIAEVIVVTYSDDGEFCNVFYVERSEYTDYAYLYSSVDGTVKTYTMADGETDYTYVSDNRTYENGSYISVNHATIIAGNDAEVTDGEIYSAVLPGAEIDYTTISWFKFVDGEWIALDTDISVEANKNVGARADVDSNGLYVLMAKKAGSEYVAPVTNLEYEQSETRDAVVTITFDDNNKNTKYRNVYYSEERFSEPEEEGVVKRTFDADEEVVVNLFERDRTVYMAVQSVAETGSRSDLSDILVLSGSADSDGDGIPDWYCDYYKLWGAEGEYKDIAGSDDDGDGLTNLEEYELGSDPTNPNDPAHTTNVPVESIKVSADTVNLSVGKTKLVTATILPENATNKDITWIIEGEDVAELTINTDGSCTIKGVGEGYTYVYAKSYDGGYVATIKVIVSEKQSAVVSLSDAVGRTGEIVKVFVSLETDEAVNTIGIRDFEYDEDVLTFVGFSDYEDVVDMSVLSSFDEEKMAVVIGLSEARIVDEDLFALNFEINDVEEGYETEVYANAVIKYNSDVVESEVSPAIVTVGTMLIGDITLDGNVDLEDALYLLQHSMFPGVYPLSYKGNVDFTKDGYVDMEDAILLLQYSMFPGIYPID